MYLYLCCKNLLITDAHFQTVLSFSPFQKSRFLHFPLRFTIMTSHSIDRTISLCCSYLHIYMLYNFCFSLQGYHDLGAFFLLFVLSVSQSGFQQILLISWILPGLHLSHHIFHLKPISHTYKLFPTLSTLVLILLYLILIIHQHYLVD